LLKKGLDNPQTSALLNNSDFDASDTPTVGYECHFGSDPIQQSLWVRFKGDGSAYRIATVQCNATPDNYLNDTQMSSYIGSCASLIPLKCNEDQASDIYEAVIIQPTTVGIEYFVLIDGYGGDIGEFCLEITQQVVNSLKEINVANLDLFPNPASDDIMVQLDGVPSGAGQLSIRNAQGRIIEQLEVNINGNEWSTQLDLSLLPPAVYFVQYVTAEGQLTKKVVKH